MSLELVFVADRDVYDCATALIAEFGIAALAEATSRAGVSRDRGNHLHYARWCRVGRAILLIEDPDPHGLLH